MVLPAFVFLPLYLYPANSTWNTLTTSIAANPDLDFHLVINPNLVSPYPDLNYVSGLKTLNNFTNVMTLGYVYTSWGTRPIADVHADVATYAGWANYSGANIGVSGIFFDEAPSSYTNETSAYMSNVTTFAKSVLPEGKQHITFNPGVPVNESFYELADTINIFENSWAAVNLSALDAVPWDLLKRSTSVIHNFTGDNRTQANLIRYLTDSNLGGMLITTQDGYTEWSSTWADFCQALTQSDDNALFRRRGRRGRR